MSAEPTAVNHHAGHAACSGLTGFLAGLAMGAFGTGRVRFTLDLAGVSAADRAVDVGCGPGNAVRGAARRGARATGVDPSSEMLWIARAVSRRRPGLEWVQGSAEHLPLPDASATVLWTVASVHHWTDVGAGLAEAFRVLEPGGRFLALERRVRPGATGLGSHGWTPQQVKAFASFCRAAGFVDVGTEERSPGRLAMAVVRAVHP
jgi:ubiquinone/menaquinone biosynthesis C-methylase UbiE